MHKPTPRVVIADDHPVFRMALRQLMPQVSTLELESFAALKTSLQTIRPELVLLDLAMPDVDGFSALLYLRSHYPELRVAVVSGHEQPGIIARALELGACAYLPKSLPLGILGAALDKVLGGESWAPDISSEPAEDDEDTRIAKQIRTLSPQQLRVLIALADGRLNKQVAAELNITEATVKFHVTALLQKLGLSRRTQLAIVVQKLARLGIDGASTADSL